MAGVELTRPLPAPLLGLESTWRSTRLLPRRTKGGESGAEWEEEPEGARPSHRRQYGYVFAAEAELRPYLFVGPDECKCRQHAVTCGRLRVPPSALRAHSPERFGLRCRIRALK